MDVKTLFANVTVDHPGDFDPSKGIDGMPSPCKGIDNMPSTCIDELTSFVQKLTEPVNGIPMAFLSSDYSLKIPVAYTTGIMGDATAPQKYVYITNIEYKGNHIEYIGLDLWSSGTYASQGGRMLLYATLPEALNIIWQFVIGTAINKGIYIGGSKSYSNIY